MHACMHACVHACIHACLHAWYAQGDRSVQRVVQEWNRITLSNQAPKVEALMRDVTRALQTGGGEPAFADVYRLAEEASKKVTILSQIGRADGLQVCHADTLVACCLLDTEGVLTGFERRCEVSWDDKYSGRPLFEAAEASAVCTLWAEDEVQKVELQQQSFRVLQAAIPPQDSGLR